VKDKKGKKVSTHSFCYKLAGKVKQLIKLLPVISTRILCERVLSLGTETCLGFMCSQHRGVGIADIGIYIT